MANLTIDEILEQVEILCRKYEVEHLYLFGSRASGTATGTSDIDIVVKYHKIQNFATGSPRETLRTACSVQLILFCCFSSSGRKPGSLWSWGK
ncbi:MAG: nucleotidyltransferase domain-containing protein [Lachnospiraceae bacterium]|nr:nucleotidyltransferase domain-containing protein [Lachnospiraceae bacterium]